jgi:hypothetical protein
LISPGERHDAAAVVVPQMGCRAGEAAPDRTAAVGMKAPRPPKSTGGICCGSGCWGLAGTRAAGKTGRHLVHLCCCKRAKHTEALSKRGRQWAGQWRMAACRRKSLQPAPGRGRAHSDAVAGLAQRSV